MLGLELAHQAIAKVELGDGLARLLVVGVRYCLGLVVAEPRCAVGPSKVGALLVARPSKPDLVGLDNGVGHDSSPASAALRIIVHPSDCLIRYAYSFCEIGDAIGVLLIHVDYGSTALGQQSSPSSNLSYLVTNGKPGERRESPVKLPILGTVSADLHFFQLHKLVDPVSL